MKYPRDRLIRVGSFVKKRDSNSIKNNIVMVNVLLKGVINVYSKVDCHS